MKKMKERNEKLEAEKRRIEKARDVEMRKADKLRTELCGIDKMLVTAAREEGIDVKELLGGG